MIGLSKSMKERAYKARAEWNKTLWYLRQQGEERLELEKIVF